MTNQTAAVIGGGVIGGGWIARFALMGWQVNIYDPDPEAPRKVQAVLDNATHSLPSLYEQPLPKQGAINFCDSLEEAVAEVAWVSECVPERLELKQKVLADIQRACPSDAVISSSTSGFKPSELQSSADDPQQIIVAHPFNPVYLIPLVELVGDLTVVEKANEILTSLGMFAIHVRKEIDAHIADRLLEAVWREGLWLVNDGIATTEEIDDAIRYGFGLRWAQMGLFETYRVAGGEAGMAHFIGQFGPALKWPWTKLMDVPELTDELVQTIADQSDEQSGMHTIRELERIRDNNLVAMMRGLKTQNWGAGELLNKVDATLFAQREEPDFKKMIRTVERIVPADWVDYNGHMNESRYGHVFSDAAVAFMQFIGADANYIADGLSFFTVDTHIRYIDECRAGDQVRVDSKVLLCEGKKVQLYHEMTHADGRLLCSGEQFMLHVNLTTRKSCPPRADLAETLATIAEQQKSLI
ncbi:MAG: carnitine 3-dehydrogenase [Pseudomonadota bacterium]